jgi:hypothetical protein
VSAGIGLLAVALAAVAVSAGAWEYARRRRTARSAQRIAALAEVARRVDAAIAAVEPVPAAPAAREKRARAVDAGPTSDQSGRVAFVEATEAAVATARADGSRLAIGLVVTAADPSPWLAERIGVAAGAPVYSVGTRSLALLLPGLGRAGALGVLARVQATCGPGGRAVELAPGEDATELIARLLAPAADLDGASDGRERGGPGRSQGPRGSY